MVEKSNGLNQCCADGVDLQHQIADMLSLSVNHMVQEFFFPPDELSVEK